MRSTKKNRKKRRISQSVIRKNYLANEERIKKAYSFDSKIDPEQAFETEIRSIVEQQNMTTTEAVKQAFRSELFTPIEERFKRNALKALRNTNVPGDNTTPYAIWRKLTQHQKIDLNLLVYKGYNDTGDYQIYEYTNVHGRLIQILFYLSPEKIIVL